MDHILIKLFSDLITAFHILHRFEVLDECGEISARNPRNPTTFFTSAVPAILVSSPHDLNEWHIDDGAPVENPSAGCNKIERVAEHSEHYAHSSIYKRFPGVKTIIHSHCPSAIQYGLCNSSRSMLQASYLMAGFIGASPPIFEISKLYDLLPETHPHNLLVNNQFLGDALATLFDKTPHEGMVINGEHSTDLPEHNVVFQRGHGYITWADSIGDAVWRAIHVRRDANIQTAVMGQRGSTDIEVVYLSQREAADCDRTTNRASPEHWLAWTTEVDRSGFYHNDLR